MELDLAMALQINFQKADHESAAAAQVLTQTPLQVAHLARQSIHGPFSKPAAFREV